MYIDWLEARLPTHTAPNHGDCKITCPNGGYAIYIEPYGPCVTGCTPDELSNDLQKNIGDNPSFVSSGVIQGITKGQLSNIVKNIAPAIGGPAMIEVVRKLSDTDRANDVVNGTWSKQKIDDSLNSIL